MGKRLENWLNKCLTTGTQTQWRHRFKYFSLWAAPQLGCAPEQVDDIIRKDFETMPSHLFQDKYRDLLAKYVASLSGRKANSARAFITGVRSFFSSEAMEITLQRGKIPKPKMAENEHRFNLEELRQMWLVADMQGKAILSTTVSLGWSVGDILELDKASLERNLSYSDQDGYVSFDSRRKKTDSRARAILNPSAVKDLKNWVRVSENSKSLWTISTDEGMNYWFKSLVGSAGLKTVGTVRFHLLRKYTYDVAVSRIGIFEAKLLTGKAISIEDETYLHSLEDRLLERYKQNASQYLRLDGIQEAPENKVTELEERLRKQETTLEYVQNQLQNTKTLLENTEKVFNKSVDKLVGDIKELNQKISALEDEDGERNSKNALFDSKEEN